MNTHRRLDMTIKTKMQTTKRVAVIGAGTSGLLAMKSLKEENFEPVCFEKTSRIGGLWHYHEDDIEGVPSCMWCTSLNNSKEPGAISDFPPRSDYPNYMRHFKVLDMFMEYGKKFNLLHHIMYNKEVIRVIKTQDYKMTGNWKVVVEDTITGNHSEDVFSGVLVCTGHLSIPNVPQFPGMSSFKGNIMHSHSLKKFLDFDNKTVCVIGTGSSALDSAVEISHVAKQVYMSIRTPTWIMSRHGPYGYPLDWSILKWNFAVLQNYLPRSICNKTIQEIFIDPRFSHNLYNIHPKHGPLDRDFALSDALPNRLMSGAIILKKNVNYFTENGVVFCEEGNNVTNVDIVVLATGYRWEFPFLDPEDLIIQDKMVHLYKCVYPPHLAHPTLGIIGFIVPMGPGFPCVEMQSRWFVHVMSGKSKLPSQEKMLADINRQYKENLKHYGKNSRIYIHVDVLPYLEDLASKIGAKPNLIKMLFSDPELFLACVFGVYLPYRFRLVGPHKWKGAREAILTADQRMKAALQGNSAFNEKHSKFSSKNVFISCCLVLTWYLWKNNFINFKFLDFLIQLLVSFYSKALQLSKAEFWFLKRFLENNATWIRSLALK